MARQDTNPPMVNIPYNRPATHVIQDNTNYPPVHQSYSSSGGWFNRFDDYMWYDG